MDKDKEKEKEKKEYEIAFLAKLPEASVLTDLLNQYRAEIFYQSPINEVRLAYPIKKQRQAYFGFFSISGRAGSRGKSQESITA